MLRACVLLLCCAGLASAKWTVAQKSFATVATAVSADADGAFVAGDQNGAGPFIYSMDKTAQNLTQCVFTATELLFLDIGNHGKFAATTGAAFLMEPVLETHDGFNFTSAPMVPPTLYVSQSMVPFKANPLGLASIGAKGFQQEPGVYYTADGGVTWKESEIKQFLNVTYTGIPRYGSFPSNTVWYVTSGDFPSSNSVAEHEHAFSKSVTLNKKDHTFRRSSGPPSNTDDDLSDDDAGPTGWWLGAIAKSSDAGKTWEVQYLKPNATEFYFNQISCPTESDCWAVSEGAFTAIWSTHDGGANWNYTVMGDSPDFGLMAIEMLSTTEGFALGSQEGGLAKGLVYQTTDGVTWNVVQEIEGVLPNNIAMVDKTLGYATAFNVLDESDILIFNA